MKAVRQQVGGRLFVKGARSVLSLADLNPAAETADLVYLCYGFVLRGTHQVVLPALVLDDWGNEIKGLTLYRWVRDNGELFPRAEIFGFALDGSKTQCFLREVELYARHPCYAYQTHDAPVAEGVVVEGILLPEKGAVALTRMKKPENEEIKRPLRAARVSWWQAPSATVSFDFSRLPPPDPGF